MVTSRDKDVTLQLLDNYGIIHTALGKAGRGLSGVLLELPGRSVRLWRVARRFKPDVMVGVGGSWIAPVGRWMGVPAVVFYGTEVAKLNNAYVYRLAKAVCTPVSYQGSAGRHHVRYQGNHELAYLYPSRFTPDARIVESAGIATERPYIFLRTVAWTSHHDVGEGGFSNLPAMVERLERYGKVVISAEGSLPSGLEGHRIKIPAHLVHHVLAFATLYLGESATMASESAMLGVPAIFVSSTRRGFIEEQEFKYGLTFTFSDRERRQADALAKAEELLQIPDLREKWKVKRDEMLERCVDVTDWMVDFIEKYASTSETRG